MIRLFCRRKVMCALTIFSEDISLFIRCVEFDYNKMNFNWTQMVIYEFILFY